MKTRTVVATNETTGAYVLRVVHRTSYRVERGGVVERRHTSRTAYYVCDGASTAVKPAQSLADAKLEIGTA